MPPPSFIPGWGQNFTPPQGERFGGTAPPPLPRGLNRVTMLPGAGGKGDPQLYAVMMQLLGMGPGGGPAMGGAPNMGGGAVGGMGGGMAGGAIPRPMGGPGSFGGGSPRVGTQDLIAAGNRPLAPLPPPPGLPGGSFDKVLGQAPRRIGPFDQRQYGELPPFKMPTYQPGGAD